MQKERNSSIEILRILAMLGIVIMHTNPIGVLDDENEIIIPTQVACVEAFSMERSVQSISSIFSATDESEVQY